MQWFVANAVVWNILIVHNFYFTFFWLQWEEERPSDIMATNECSRITASLSMFTFMVLTESIDIILNNGASALVHPKIKNNATTQLDKFNYLYCIVKECALNRTMIFLCRVRHLLHEIYLMPLRSMWRCKIILVSVIYSRNLALRCHHCQVITMLPNNLTCQLNNLFPYYNS